MGYVLTKTSVEQVRMFLLKLKDGLPHVFVTPNPQKFAYAMRQGQAAARAIQDRDSPPISYRFLVGTGKVTAVPQDTNTLARSDPTNGLQVIQSLMSDTPVAEVAFPNAKLEPHEIERIANWALPLGIVVALRDNTLYAAPKELLNG